MGSRPSHLGPMSRAASYHIEDGCLFDSLFVPYPKKQPSRVIYQNLKKHKMLFESYLLNGLHICGGQKGNHQHGVVKRNFQIIMQSDDPSPQIK